MTTCCFEMFIAVISLRGLLSRAVGTLKTDFINIDGIRKMLRPIAFRNGSAIMSSSMIECSEVNVWLYEKTLV